MYNFNKLALFKYAQRLWQTFSAMHFKRFMHWHAKGNILIVHAHCNHSLVKAPCWSSGDKSTGKQPITKPFKPENWLNPLDCIKIRQRHTALITSSSLQ